MSGLAILEISPGATIQDQGRTGWLRYGVTSSGAMDGHALAEGQALLGNTDDDAALEFAMRGGKFRAIKGLWIATSGAEMALSVNGGAVAWRRSLRLEPGDLIEVGAARRGVYGYLHVAGGFQTEMVLGSRATHWRAEIGHRPEAGQILPTAPQITGHRPMHLPEPGYFGAREIRFLRGPQTDLFDDQVLAEFLGAELRVGAARDRMGMRLTSASGPVQTKVGRTIASDSINPGDIQITGDGTPVVLLADRGSAGGYPRIGTIASADLPALVQIAAGEAFRLRQVTREAAVDALSDYRKDLNGLRDKVEPVVRDPHDIADLLAYNLIGGVLRGDEDERD